MSVLFWDVCAICLCELAHILSVLVLVVKLCASAQAFKGLSLHVPLSYIYRLRSFCAGIQDCMGVTHMWLCASVNACIGLVDGDMCIQMCFLIGHCQLGPQLRSIAVSLQISLLWVHLVLCHIQPTHGKNHVKTLLTSTSSDSATLLELFLTLQLFSETPLRVLPGFVPYLAWSKWLIN